ncbi:MAG: nucleotidyltransferase domain-containing protein [Chloroflexota bacterium]|nr:nucleotidyltransferase domain-containing protein [Chloroflexota bacterium]
MALPTLVFATQIPKIDNVLKGLLGLLELTFPSRVRAYYLGGSYADGSAIDAGPTMNSSDLDLLVIFKEAVDKKEETRFAELLDCCRHFATITLDAHLESENDLYAENHPTIINVFLKKGSKFLYGEDIREKLPLKSREVYTQEVLNHGLYHLGLLRQQGQPQAFPLNVPLVYPLTYPDPADEFFGYTASLQRIEGVLVPPGTRLAIAIGLWAATTNLVSKTGHFAGSKSQTVAIYREIVADEWTPLVEALFYKCKLAWQHGIPESEDERAQLRAICRQLLAFENHFLLQARHFMFEQLTSGLKSTKVEALLGLQNVVYPQDQELLAALKSASDSADEEIGNTARRTLEISSV